MWRIAMADEYTVVITRKDGGYGESWSADEATVSVIRRILDGERASQIRHPGRWSEAKSEDRTRGRSTTIGTSSGVGRGSRRLTIEEGQGRGGLHRTR
jgi:hypothetical protein